MKRRRSRLEPTYEITEVIWMKAYRMGSRASRGVLDVEKGVLVLPKISPMSSKGFQPLAHRTETAEEARKRFATLSAKTCNTVVTLFTIPEGTSECGVAWLSKGLALQSLCDKKANAEILRLHFVEFIL